MAEAQSGSMLDIEIFVMELESTADWRRRKAEEYPEDGRNTRAANILERLAKDVSSLRTHVLWRELERLNNKVIELDVDLSGIIEEENEYRRQIGFWDFPENGEEYVQHLIEIYNSHLSDRTDVDDDFANHL